MLPRSTARHNGGTTPSLLCCGATALERPRAPPAPPGTARAAPKALCLPSPYPALPPLLHPPASPICIIPAQAKNNISPLHAHFIPNYHSSPLRHEGFLSPAVCGAARRGAELRAERRQPEGCAPLRSAARGRAPVRGWGSSVPGRLLRLQPAGREKACRAFRAPVLRVFALENK